MKSSTQDKVEGNLHQASGKVKEVVGKAINNHEMTAKGKAENAAGKVQEKVGEIKKVLGK
jgi:uncharacterized protein YjbJ (UPF0337 family)